LVGCSIATVPAPFVKSMNFMNGLAAPATRRIAMP